MWTEIRLPAIAEEDDPIGRKPGEPLCPERYKIHDLLRIRDQMGPQLFDALYQQNPSASGAQMFKQDWWQYYQDKDEINFDVVIQSWDCGYTKTENSSYSVCATIGASNDQYFVMDIFRARLEFPELMRAVKNNFILFHPDMVLIEAEASGISVIQTLYSETQLPIKAIKLRNRTKIERAWEITHLIEAGKVFLDKDAKWYSDFMDEITAFPNSQYLDQVDALTQGLYFLKTTPIRWAGKRPTEVKRVSTGREPLYPESTVESFRGSSLDFRKWLR